MVANISNKGFKQASLLLAGKKALNKKGITRNYVSLDYFIFTLLKNV